MPRSGDTRGVERALEDASRSLRVAMSLCDPRTSRELIRQLARLQAEISKVKVRPKGDEVSDPDLLPEDVQADRMRERREARRGVKRDGEAKR